jgi:hypothetical protein
MTEGDAKTKWCPFSRVITGKAIAGTTTADAPSNQPSFNNRLEVGPASVMLPDGSVCLGSACMAWRWDYVVDQETPRFDPTAPDLYKHSTTDGYCGLAGKP